MHAKAWLSQLNPWSLAMLKFQLNASQIAGTGSATICIPSRQVTATSCEGDKPQIPVQDLQKYHSWQSRQPAVHANSVDLWPGI